MRGKLPCIACGALEREIVQVQPGVRIHATGVDEVFEVRTALCASCGLVFSDPQPEPELLERFYAGQHRELFADTHKIPGEGSRRDQAVWIESRLGPLAGKRILEVGCYDGYLLHLLERRGAHCIGVEPSARAALHGRERFGVDIRTGRFEDVALEEASFDLIAMSHVAEHLRDPGEALRRAHALLRADGSIFLEVPNVLAPRVENAVNFFTFDHLYNFSPRTLARLARRHGFETLAVDVDFPFPAFRSLARRIDMRDSRVENTPVPIRAVEECRGAVAKYVDQRAEFVARLRQRVSLCVSRWNDSDARVVIYGAGDHTEHLLAQTDLSRANLVALVDGDPAKQGELRFGLPVHSPEALSALRADAVIVSSYDFQEEMRATLLRSCDVSVEICTLYERVDAFSSYASRIGGPEATGARA